MSKSLQEKEKSKSKKTSPPLKKEEAQLGWDLFVSEGLEEPGVSESCDKSVASPLSKEERIASRSTQDNDFNLAEKKNIPKKGRESFLSKDPIQKLVADQDQEADQKREASPDATPHIYSIGEINKLIKGKLEEDFSHIWIKGEISNFKAHSSGHFYFSLKDEKAQINAVMFKGLNRHLKFRPQDGMEVMARGKITVYEPRGTYQIFCEVLEPLGAGALQIAFEQLKKKLSGEGLFDKEKKRAIPEHVKKVAVVTSPTGAAIRDILNVLSRRMKSLEVVIVPCSVQGKNAASEIVKAIELANQIKGFDVMIVGRGGGSIEDLWPFNEETVARAIHASQIPTVSAVGHEIDFTISDFVADLRAPTPSAAAELVSKSSEEVLGKLSLLKRNLLTIIHKKIQMEKQNLFHIKKRLIDPKRKLLDLAMKCDELEARLFNSIKREIYLKKQMFKTLRARLIDPKRKILEIFKKTEELRLRLKGAIKSSLQRNQKNFLSQVALLNSLNPLQVLERGYSVTKDKKGKIIKEAEQMDPEEEIEIQLFKGRLSAKVLKIFKKKDEKQEK